MREILEFEKAEKQIPPPADCRGRRLGFERVRIMGVINATPDSFSDGGRFFDPAAALDMIARMAEEGADIVDIGGESTRPGSGEVDEAEELRRVMPILEKLDPETGPLISIDTHKPSVARAALAAGAHIVNDVGGLGNPEIAAAAAAAGAAAVAMHMKGEPRTMQETPVYADVVREVAEFLAGRASGPSAPGSGASGWTPESASGKAGTIIWKYFGAFRRYTNWAARWSSASRGKDSSARRRG